MSQFAHKKGESLSNTFLNREKRGMISVQPCPINKAVVPPKEIYCFSHCFPTPAGSCIKKNDSHPTKTKIITVPPLNLLKMKFCSPLGWKWLHCVWKLNKRVIVKDDWVTYVRSCLKWIFLSWRNKIQFIMKPTNIDWWRSSKLFFYSKNHFVRLNDPDRGGVNPWDFHLASGIQGSFMKSRRVISQSEMALKPRNRTASRKKRHE